MLIKLGMADLIYDLIDIAELILSEYLNIEGTECDHTINLLSLDVQSISILKTLKLSDIEDRLLLSFRKIDNSINIVNLSYIRDNKRVYVVYTKESDICVLSEVGIYSYICSLLEPKDISNLSKTNKMFDKLYNNNEFWTLINMKKYPYIKANTNAKKMYQGASYYGKMIQRRASDRYNIIILTDKYPELLLNLLDTDLIKLNDSTFTAMINYFTSDYSIDKLLLFEKIISKHLHLVNSSSFEPLFNYLNLEALIMLDSILTKYNLDMTYMNMRNLLLTYRGNNSLQKYKYLQYKLCIEYTVDMYLKDYLICTSKKITKYIINQLPDDLSIDTIINTIITLFNSDMNDKLFLLYIRYKYKISDENKRVLSELFINSDNALIKELFSHD